MQIVDFAPADAAPLLGVWREGKERESEMTTEKGKGYRGKRHKGMGKGEGVGKVEGKVQVKKSSKCSLYSTRNH